MATIGTGRQNQSAAQGLRQTIKHSAESFFIMNKGISEQEERKAELTLDLWTSLLKVSTLGMLLLLYILQKKDLLLQKNSCKALI